MTRCPRCGHPTADRDPQAREHTRNVRKLVGWIAAFPFTLGVAVTLTALLGAGALR